MASTRLTAAADALFGNARGFTLSQVIVTMGISATLLATAAPMTKNLYANFRIQGDARTLANTVSQAKLRSAAQFTKSRIFVDLNSGSYHIEVWNKGTPGAWATQATDGERFLSSAEQEFAFSPVASAPAGTQGTIGQAPVCLTAGGEPIGNSACIVFNSRGIPVTDIVSGTGGPTNASALYVADATNVFAITASATGVVQLWHTRRTATPTWTLL